MSWRSVVSEQQHGEPGGTQITLVLSHWSSELLCCIKYEWEVGVQCWACSLRSVLRLGGFSGCKHNSVEVSIPSALCVFYLPHRSLSSSFLWAICGQISFLNSIWVTVNKTGWLWFNVGIWMELGSVMMGFVRIARLCQNLNFCLNLGVKKDAYLQIEFELKLKLIIQKSN